MRDDSSEVTTFTALGAVYLPICCVKFTVHLATRVTVSRDQLQISGRLIGQFLSRCRTDEVFDILSLDTDVPTALWQCT